MIQAKRLLQVVTGEANSLEAATQEALEKYNAIPDPKIIGHVETHPIESAGYPIRFYVVIWYERTFVEDSITFSSEIALPYNFLAAN